MIRNILIIGLCFGLASLGISGLHAHLPGAPDHESHSHGHEPGSSGPHGADLYTVISPGHIDSHDQDRAIDIEPFAKAFGKLSLLQLYVAGAFLYAVFELLSRICSLLVRWTPPRRPPRRRLRNYFLPPAHAPPCTASQR